MERICMLVKYVEHPETASYTWDYAGGCFEKNIHDTDHIKYKPADIGTVYDFDKIPIEVRQVNSDFIEDIGGSSGAGFLWFLFFISVLLFIVALAALGFKLYL